jgi:hypothetical protein
MRKFNAILAMSGETLSLINIITDIIDQLAEFAKEVTKVMREVVQAEVGNVQGI